MFVFILQSYSVEFAKCTGNTQYLSRNMLHDDLQQLEAENCQKLLDPISQKVNVPHWRYIYRIFQIASILLNIFRETCFMIFYID